MTELKLNDKPVSIHYFTNLVSESNITSYVVELYCSTTPT